MLVMALAIPTAGFAAADAPSRSQLVSTAAGAQASAGMGLMKAFVRPAAVVDAATTYVYITKSGTKYHRHDCVSHHGHTKVTLHHAKVHHKLTACKVCKPPR